METTRILTKNGVENTNIDGARDNNFNAGGRSGIVKGVLNEGTFTAQGNEMVFDTCELRISGHRVVIEEPSRISLSGTPYSAERFQYIAKITNIDGEISFELITTLIHELEQDDILNGNGVYELEIGRFTHDTSGNITDVVRTADVITGGTGSGGSGDFSVGNVTTQTLDAGLNAEVDVEYNTETGKVDFSFAIPQGEKGNKGDKGDKGDPGIGNATLSNVDGDSTENGFTQSAVKGVAQAKNYYNLGIYDTYVSNGDGTATITRKTEYVYNYNIKSYSINAPYPYPNFCIMGNFEVPSSVPFSAQSNKGVIRIYNALAGELNCWRENGQTFENDEEFQDFINGLVIQYEITNSYTEIVIENQPLNILDQNGSQWLREEYKKSITDSIIHKSEVPIYFNTENISPASTIGGTWTSLGSFACGSTTVYAWKRV